MRIGIALFILLLIASVVVTAQPWTLPDDPPPTYTPVPQFVPGGVGQPTPPFEIIQAPEPQSFTPTKPSEGVRIIKIKLCYLFNISKDQCLD